MKELEVRYEQYFAGIERREPYNERRNLARRLRQFTNRAIVWTELKFRYQGAGLKIHVLQSVLGPHSAFDR